MKGNLDRKLISFSNINGASHEFPQILYIASFPCYVTGILVDGTVTTTYTTNIVNYQWYLAVVDEGQNLFTPIFNSAPALQSSFQPEENVLCFGAGSIVPNTSNSCVCRGEVSKKLMTGDSIQFTIIAELNTDRFGFSFVVQFYLRT